MSQGDSIRTLACVLISLLALGTLGRSEDLPRTFAALKLEYERASAPIEQRRDRAATDAERVSAQADLWRLIQATAARARTWADAHPQDPESIDAILWTIQGLVSGYDPRYETETNQALDRLSQRALHHETIAPFCYYAASTGFASASTRQFLEAALEQSQSPLVRGSACLGLARSYHRRAEFIRLAQEPLTRKSLEAGPYAGLLGCLAAEDPEAHDRQAEILFQKVIDHFAEQKLSAPYNSTPFAALARGELFELQHLAIGQVIPRIEGEALDGTRLRLDDYRGQVVVLVFWATWCGPCLEMIPHERDLMKRYRDRAFTLVGVNGDNDRASALELQSKQAMNWPSFWNGGSTGGLVERLGVRSWPTVYLLDGAGTIRFKNLRGADLDSAIERLLAELPR